jgi:hypothetical protein
MNPDQITNTFIAGKHQITIYDNFGYYTLTLRRGAYFARSWPVGNYRKALAVAKRLIDLSSDQRDMIIIDPQGVLGKLK